MKRLMACLVALTICIIAFAQNPNPIPAPKLTAIFPSGVQAGHSVDVVFTGVELGDAKSVVTSHADLTATIINDTPVSPEKDKDKEKSKEKDKSKDKSKAAPANTTTVKVRVTAKENLAHGHYDVRLVTKQGITNPRLITVSAFRELVEREPNNDLAEAMPLELAQSVCGQFLQPTDVDFYRFGGKAGQRVCFHVAASSIDSRARPLIELYSSDGRRLTQNRNDRGNDAMIDVTLPSTGDYFVRLCEFAYQFGGPEYGYRLTSFSGPYVETVFPPVYSNKTKFTLTGSGLKSVNSTISPTASRLKMDAMQGLMDIAEFRLPGSVHGQAVFAAREEIILEASTPNDTAETAHALKWPCELCGRIEIKNDLDWYRITAKKGEPVMIDLAAERIGSPIDTYLSIRDAKSGKEIAGEQQLDDEAEPLHPITFFSRSLDPPAYRFEPPADGDYLIRVASREAHQVFGPRAFYRLRVSPPRPDYRVIAMPRSKDQPYGVIIRPGMDSAIDVYVYRIDGYAGPVTVIAEKLPYGVTAMPAIIGTNQKWGTLILKSKADVKSTVFDLNLKATASIDGQERTHAARPATIEFAMPQNTNNPALTRLDQSMPAAVTDGIAWPKYAINADIGKAKTSDGKIWLGKKLKPSEKVKMPIDVSFSGGDRGPITLALELTHSDTQRSPFSGNNANVQVTIAKEKNEAEITLEARPNAVPGVYRMTLRGDMTTPVEINGKKPSVTLTAWTTVDVTIEK